MNPDSELVRQHIQKGGVAAIYENGYLSIVKGDWRHRIERAARYSLDNGRTSAIYDCQRFGSRFGSIVAERDD